MPEIERRQRIAGRGIGVNRVGWGSNVQQQLRVECVRVVLLEAGGDREETYSGMYDADLVERITEAGVVAGGSRNICSNARAGGRRLVGRACLLQARAIVFKIRSDAAESRPGHLSPVALLRARKLLI